MREHIKLMATYNEWMNAKVYDAAGRLSADELAMNRGAFFGSILGTLNHIMVGDRVWLSRFANHPAKHAALDPLRTLTAPTSLDQILYTDFQALKDHRVALDTVIKEWVATLTDADLDRTLHYASMKGTVFKKPFGSLLMHFFNHQTHHRGQATTLLSQAGQDVGVTDLLVLISDPIDEC
jgi:uncharacterized damage-inducible protein DinB